MRIFVAGGSGTIGIPLVRALTASGHSVTALTRSSDKQSELRSLGATPAFADALDRTALIAAVEAARPTHVIHELTALPKQGPLGPRDLNATNLLRIDGTRNLLEAAINAGAGRFVVGSFALLSPRGPDTTPSDDDAATAIRSMESQVMEATSKGLIEGVILRYGMFYGLETPSTVMMIEMVRKRWLPVVRDDEGQLPLIHVDDAVSATLARTQPCSGRQRLRHRRRSSREYERNRRSARAIFAVGAALQGPCMDSPAGRALHGTPDDDADAAFER